MAKKEILVSTSYQAQGGGIFWPVYDRTGDEITLDEVERIAI